MQLRLPLRTSLEILVRRPVLTWFGRPRGILRRNSYELINIGARGGRLTGSSRSVATLTEPSLSHNGKVYLAGKRSDLPSVFAAACQLLRPPTADNLLRQLLQRASIHRNRGGTPPASAVGRKSSLNTVLDGCAAHQGRALPVTNSGVCWFVAHLRIMLLRRSVSVAHSVTIERSSLCFGRDYQFPFCFLSQPLSWSHGGIAWILLAVESKFRLITWLNASSPYSDT
jgi:hypothetical protein